MQTTFEQSFASEKQLLCIFHNSSILNPCSHFWIYSFIFSTEMSPQYLCFYIITSLALLLGASPFCLKLYFSNKGVATLRCKLCFMIWWFFSISAAVWFSIISFDTIHSDWDSNQRLVSNLAVTGVTFVEYSVRVLVRFMCLFKTRSLTNFIFYLHRHCKSLSFQNIKSADSQWNYNFFKIGYISFLIISLFNIRMEYKADREYFHVRNDLLISLVLQ